MRFLFSISYYWPHVSGLSICTQRIAEGMAERGHDVTVLCMKHTNDLASLETKNKVRIIRVDPDIKLGKGFWANRWIPAVDRLIRTVDLVVVNSPQFEGMFTSLISWFRRRPVVDIYHCELTNPSGLFNKLTQIGADFATRVTTSLADKIVVYTKDYAYSSRGLRNKDKKIVEIYPPVPKFPGKKIKRPRHGLVVGIAARIAAEKGIEYLLEAIRNEPLMRVMIAGPREAVGEEAYKEKIEVLVKPLGDRVEFLGSLRPEKMGDFYRQIDVLVLPSVNSTEAFGLVQAEAMRCKVPVVATDLPGVRMPIKLTGAGIIVPPKDPRALTEALKKVKTSYAKYVKHCDVAEMFADDISIKKYEEVFTNILGK